MQIYYHKNYNSAKHEFDTTRKASVIAEQLDPMETMSPDYFLGMAGYLIEKYHSAPYIIAIRDGKDAELAESNGFEWCPNIYTMAKYNTAGVLASADFAVSNCTISGSLSSGIHHASYERGAGFCTVNSLAIAAFDALKGDRHSSKKVLILDFDAHNGGGTVDMIRHNGFDKNVHQIDLSTSEYDEYEQDSKHVINYAHDDETYLAKVSEILKNSKIDRNEYCLVLYNAGVDSYPKVSHSTLKARDEMVFKFCVDNDVPCSFVLAGGYTDVQSMDSLVESHMNTIRAAEKALNDKYSSVSSQTTTMSYQDVVIAMDSINPEALFADGLEDAVIGHTRILSTGTNVVVYDSDKVIEVLMRDNDMTYEEAVEYAEFNVFSAYMGENTPLFMWGFDEQ